MAKMQHHTHNLLKAIEGYKGAAAGSEGYEGVQELLQRVKEEALKGHSTQQDSPGKRQAADAAFQRDHPSEAAHSVGDGNVRSNEPGGAEHGQTPPEVFEREGSSADKIKTGAAPPPSRGNVISAMPAHGFTGGEAQIRRAAAEKEMSRPESKMASTAEKNKPGGNKESVAPAPPARGEGRIGDVSAPEITNTQRHGEAAKAGREAQTPPEARPPYAQQDIGGDRWSRASAKAKAKMAMQKAVR